VQNNSSYVLGNIQKNSLHEIWLSEASQKLREKHMGQIPSTCSANQEKFICHRVGLRKNYGTAPLKLKRLDLMLDSACNLTCIMCTNIYDKTGGFKSSFFWENNKDVFKQIEEIELVGGEPLISPHYFKLVSLVTPLNQNIDWRITTNAHFPLTPTLQESFQAINLKSISVSLDSLRPEVFQTIRQRSDFSLTFDNIFKLGKIIPKVQVNMVVQSLNCDEVVSMFKWTRENKFSFYPILLTYPTTYSLLSRSQEVNKKWLLDLISQNEAIQSAELFFLIKKSAMNLGLLKDPDIFSLYLEQLKILERPDES
jgi:MoaA/NifB/PqqE/SkfB family radical SAM enzyme